MFVINTTFVIDRQIYDEFLIWLSEVYVNAAMKTNIFLSNRIAQVISNEDPHTVSIACEFTCQSLSEGVCWNDTTSQSIRHQMLSQWGDKALFFTTYLKTIE